MTSIEINRERLANTFRDLICIDSPSREEGAVAKWIGDILTREIGAEVEEDQSRDQTGSETGNIIVRIPGTRDTTPVFFNAHLDTVEPGRGIRPVFKDGVFYSDGHTVLGSDDKAAVAILIEVARLLKEHEVPHGPIEFLFTVCEEIGLLGAKAFDPTLLRARIGYVLDSDDIETLINRAPCATRFKIRLIGKAAHAGISPEQGINAIQIAARALTDLPLGRIDEITTANVGLIHGGKATNIVPDEVELSGEVRSHNPERLREVQGEILEIFRKTTEAFEKRDQGLPCLESEVIDDYPLMSVPDGHSVVTYAMKAGEAIGKRLRLGTTGGGSDANILNSKGLSTLLIGVGMHDVHTTSESIRLDDMVTSARLVLQIISCL